MRNVAYACLQLLVAASFAISMGLGAASPVAAATGNQWQHILDCTGLLFTNPAQHAIECGPGHVGDMTSDSRGWGYQATPPAAAPEKCAPAVGALPGFGGPSLLLVGQTACCPIAYQLLVPGVRVVPVFCCIPQVDLPGGTTDTRSGLFLKVDNCNPAAFRFEDLTLPGLTI